MAKTIGRNINFNDTATLSSAIALNSTTSTKIGDSVVLPSQLRIFFSVSNNSNKDIWIKMQADSVDNDKKGIFVPRNGYWEIPMDNVYHGEISAIADSGSPSIYITEY